MRPKRPSRGCPTIDFVQSMLLLCFSSITFVTSQQDFHFQYLERPVLQWKQQLAGMSVGIFNVVEQSPIDENILYMTTYGATLVVLSALDGSILSELIPPSNAFATTTTTTTIDVTSCRSGISFGVMPNGSVFLVYTVTDISKSNNDNANSASMIGSNRTLDATSRVVAISIPEHKSLWSSDSLPGDSMGSPVVLYESTQRTPYVAFTHNAQVTLADNSTATSGSFTLLHPANGQIIWTESESSREEFPKGYGPLGVAINPIAGNYLGGENNDNDLVVWGTFDRSGKQRNQGNTHVFQLPQNFQETQTNIQRLSTSILKSVRWTTMTRPVFGDQGRSMYLGVTGDQVRGWTGNNHFDEAADWEADLSVESTDRSSLIPASPALSIDGQRLFVSTSTFSIHGIDSSTGGTIWDFVGTSLVQAEPRVSPDNQRVYVAQSLDGRILSIDQQDGSVFWSISCDDFEEGCSNSVHASFALSHSGEYLYYADIFGKIISLTVGNFVERLQGVKDEVTSVIVSVDDLTPSHSHTKSGHLNGVKATFGILAFVISCGIGVLMYLIRRERLNGSRKTRMTRNEPNQTSFHDFVKDDYDFFPTTPSRGAIYPTIRSHCHSFKEGYPQVNAPQNNFPMPLQGRHRVAPFEEDYSFGATVLL